MWCSLDNQGLHHRFQPALTPGKCSLIPTSEQSRRLKTRLLSNRRRLEHSHAWWQRVWSKQILHQPTHPSTPNPSALASPSAPPCAQSSSQNSRSLLGYRTAPCCLNAKLESQKSKHRFLFSRLSANERCESLCGSYEFCRKYFWEIYVQMSYFYPTLASVRVEMIR